MSHRLQIARWALDGALDIVGDDPAPWVETVAAVMAVKREIALAGIEVCDLSRWTSQVARGSSRAA